MKKVPNSTQNPNDKSSAGGCVPMIVSMVGFGMLLVGVLAVLNTAFGWELVLEVYGSDMEVPKYWDSTIGVLVVGAIIAGIGWIMGRPSVIRFYRKNKLLVILGSIGLIVGVFFLLNEYDKSIRRANEREFARMDSLRAANPEAYQSEESEEPEEPAYNPYADREITFIVTNPTVETMQVLVDGKKAFEVKPYEIGKDKMSSGQHRLTAIVEGDTVEAVELDLPERTKETKDEVTVINVDSFFNIGALNFQDYYDSDNKKRKEAKTINYRLESLNWHEHIFTIDVNNPSLLFPRRASLDISYGTALKIVFVPDELEGDRDKAFDYVIWKFIDEEKKGFVQDGLDFFKLSDEEKKEAIRNRLVDDMKRFEAEN